jgi:hypothetical protein
MKDISPWDALNLDQDHPNKEEQEQLRIEVKRKYRACFGTDAGKWVLEHLNGMVFNRPVVDVNVQNPEVMAGIREGEMSVMRQIHILLQPEK